MIKAFFIYCSITSGACFTEYVKPHKDITVTEMNCLKLAIENVASLELDFKEIYIKKFGCERNVRNVPSDN